jgi:hypothetical protein
MMCHIQIEMSLTYCDYNTKEHKMSESDVPHVETDMSLTPCDYKTEEHRMSESNVPCSNRHVTYILQLHNTGI